MTKDEIIRIAKEAGGELEDGLWLFFERECLRFATMIATHEREANCACIGRIAALVADPIDRARLYEAMSTIRARGEK